GQTDAYGLGAGGVAQHGLRFAFKRKNAPGVTGQPFARHGGLYRAGIAVHQLLADSRFESCQLLTDGRLRKMQAIGSGGKAACVDYLDKCGKKTGVKQWDSPSVKCPGTNYKHSMQILNI